MQWARCTRVREGALCCQSMSALASRSVAQGRRRHAPSEQTLTARIDSVQVCVMLRSSAGASGNALPRKTGMPRASAGTDHVVDRRGRSACCHRPPAILLAHCPGDKEEGNARTQFGSSFCEQAGPRGAGWRPAEVPGARRASHVWTARACVHMGSVWLTRVLRDRTMENSLNVYAKGNPLARHCTVCVCVTCVREWLGR